MIIITSFTCVCLSIGLLTNYGSNFFMKFYSMVGYNAETNRLDFEWPWLEVKVTRGQKVKTFFANNSVQSCHRKTPQKVESRLLISLNYTKRDYRRRTNSFKDRRGQGADESGHNELDYNLLKSNLGLYVLFDCILNGLPLWRFALSECFHLGMCLNECQCPYPTPR